MHLFSYDCRHIIVIVLEVGTYLFNTLWKRLNESMV